MEASNAVLSGVHTDCKFENIPRSNYAVTRFKINFPSHKLQEEAHYKCSILNLERQVGDSAAQKPDPENQTLNDNARSKQMIICGKTQSANSDLSDSPETNKLHFDEDGDLDVKRHGDQELSLVRCPPKGYNSSSNECSKHFEDHALNLPQQRKKIKLEAPTSLNQACNICSSIRVCETESNNDMYSSSITVCEKFDDGSVSEKANSDYGEVGDCVKNKEMLSKVAVPMSQPGKPDGDIRTRWTYNTLSDNARNQQSIAQGSDNQYYLTLKHSLATDLEDVGEQIWLGALLLSDYIICNHGYFESKTIVDLGAGVGLTSIISAMYAQTVYCTDTGEKILSLAADNVSTSSSCLTLPKELKTIHVKQLDWFTGLKEENTKFGLSQEDITRIQNCDILIAADVIYDFDLTDAFFNVVQQIMSHPPAKSLYIGLEKRLVFTVEDLTVTSPGYNYFRIQLDDLCNSDNDHTDGSAKVQYLVEQIDTQFVRQCFHYDRIKQLEIWKISAILENG